MGILIIGGSGRTGQLTTDELLHRGLYIGFLASTLGPKLTLSRTQSDCPSQESDSNG